ncbi:MAG TPA: hypothetical protein VGH20_02265 [Myxococcales bacterium]|jgi:hypothetical protein
MRSIGVSSALGLAACLFACGGGSSGGSGSRGGGNPASDAGSPQGNDGGQAAPDAGATPDAGAGSDAGTAADAGGGTVSDGGTATDGGPAAGGGAPDAGPDMSACTGFGQSDLPPPVSYTIAYSSAQSEPCEDATADGKGVVAFDHAIAGGTAVDLINPSGAKVGMIQFHSGQVFAQPAGIVANTGSSVQQTVSVAGYDETGAQLDNTAINGSAIYAAAPNGGLFAAGLLAPGESTVAIENDVTMFSSTGALQYGPLTIASQGKILGAGVDLLGRAVVILDGSAKFGAGAISGIWFGPKGEQLTGEFLIIAHFTPGQFTTFDASALAGSGLALRRVDQDGAGNTTSQWLALLPSGSARVEAGPDWLVQRPNTDMKLAKGGRAYAFTPLGGAAVTSCGQQLELLTTDGNSCGKVDFVIDDQPCVTSELAVGLDGTVLQRTPSSRDRNTPPGSAVFSCELRFWPAAMR